MAMLTDRNWRTVHRLRYDREAVDMWSDGGTDGNILNKYRVADESMSAERVLRKSAAKLTAFHGSACIPSYLANPCIVW